MEYAIKITCEQDQWYAHGGPRINNIQTAIKWQTRELAEIICNQLNQAYKHVRTFKAEVVEVE